VVQGRRRGGGLFAGRYFEISLPPRHTTGFHAFYQSTLTIFLAFLFLLFFFSRSLLGFVYDFFFASALVLGFCFYLGFVLGSGKCICICICIFICGADAAVVVILVAVVSLLYLLALF